MADMGGAARKVKGKQLREEGGGSCPTARASAVREAGSPTGEVTWPLILDRQEAAEDGSI